MNHIFESLTCNFAKGSVTLNVCRCNRGWVYHRENRLWFMRDTHMEPLVKTNSYERGSYFCFDPNTWETIRKVWIYQDPFNSFHWSCLGTALEGQSLDWSSHSHLGNLKSGAIGRFFSCQFPNRPIVLFPLNDLQFSLNFSP